VNAVTTASIMICICCVACSLINLLKPSGHMQKIFNLILGIFLICSICTTAKNASASISKEISNILGLENINQSAEYIFDSEIIQQTTDNLVLTLNLLLENQKINVKDIEMAVHTSEENGISITEINIFIEKALFSRRDEIIKITEENFKVTPNVKTIDDG